MGNEKWMAAHFVLLTLVFGSYLWANFFTNSTYTAYTIYSVINCIVYILMALIMDQVNGPQYTVWANRKFVGKNKEEVAEHILHDRSTINEPELSENLADFEEHGIRAVDFSSNSIF
jgi:hypothetical protein